MNSTRHLSEPTPLLIPKPIIPGDLVGVVAASGPVDPAALKKGCEFLEKNGFRTVTGRNVLQRSGYMAGPDESRAADLNAMLGDPHIRCVWFARGGYGAMRLLDLVNHEAAVDGRKLLVGMSDVTALQLSLFARSRIVTSSGPMIAGQVAAGLDRFSEESLLAALTDPPDRRELLPDPVHSPKVVRHGSAQGNLLGGCLSIVTSLLGTPHSPDYREAVLFLEDVNEPPYRLDRMFTQLRLAGVLHDISGLVLGHFVGSGREDLRESVERMVLDLTKDEGFPVISGFPHGHALPNLTLPHGMPVRLNTEPISLSVDRSSVGT